MDMTGMFDEIKGLASSIVEKVDAAAVGLADEKAASYKEGYDVGYAEGKASIVLPSDDGEKIYSQGDMDKLAAVAKEEQSAADVALFQPQIDALAEKVAAMQVLVDGFAVEKEAAVASKVAELIAEFENVELDNVALIAKYKV